jgi:curved DNA-binding protein CbpA
MRVFHPDREDRADDWKDAFATRINLAYTTLRDADERRRYQASLQQSKRPDATPPLRRAAVHHHARRPARAPGQAGCRLSFCAICRNGCWPAAHWSLLVWWAWFISAIRSRRP